MENDRIGHISCNLRQIANTILQFCLLCTSNGYFCLSLHGHLDSIQINVLKGLLHLIVVLVLLFVKYNVRFCLFFLVLKLKLTKSNFIVERYLVALHCKPCT